MPAQDEASNMVDQCPSYLQRVDLKVASGEFRVCRVELSTCGLIATAAIAARPGATILAEDTETRGLSCTTLLGGLDPNLSIDSGMAFAIDAVRAWVRGCLYVSTQNMQVAIRGEERSRARGARRPRMRGGESRPKLLWSQINVPN